MEGKNALVGRLRAAQASVGERKGQRNRLLNEREERRRQLEQRKEHALVLEQVLLLLQQTAEHGREQAREQLEALVGSSLRAVFGPEYGFRIELGERAGRPEAEFYVTSPFGGDRLQTRPEESRGGGVVDVVSLGLRVAMLESYRPRLEGALVLDEPAKHVSEEFIGAVAQFLGRVSEVFGRQVIMVTHSAHLAESAQVSYRVQLQGDCSVVTLARGHKAPESGRQGPAGAAFPAG